LVLGILLSLGFWQLDRAAQKRALLAEYTAGGTAARLRIDAGLESVDGLQYQPATVTGRYDRRQFLLDNRTHDGMVGYQVLTPLRLSRSEAGVLVNRGWIPLGGSRGQLPELPVDDQQRTVLGRIKDVSQQGFTLGEEQPRDGWPYRVLRVDTDHLSRELGYPLLPMQLLLDPDQPDGFVRDWRPLTFGPERNTGYAVQWFALAVTLLVIYLAVNLRKRESNDHSD
jgi:surfeit locus 1 family protein